MEYNTLSSPSRVVTVADGEENRILILNAYIPDCMKKKIRTDYVAHNGDALYYMI